jgi:hypothetical protein
MELKPRNKFGVWVVGNKAFANKNDALEYCRKIEERNKVIEDVARRQLDIFLPKAN